MRRGLGGGCATVCLAAAEFQAVVNNYESRLAWLFEVLHRSGSRLEIKRPGSINYIPINILLYLTVRPNVHCEACAQEKRDSMATPYQGQQHQARRTAGLATVPVQNGFSKASTYLQATSACEYRSYSKACQYLRRQCEMQDRTKVMQEHGARTLECRRRVRCPAPGCWPVQGGSRHIRRQRIRP